MFVLANIDLVAEKQEGFAGARFPLVYFERPAEDLLDWQSRSTGPVLHREVHTSALAARVELPWVD